MASSTTSNLFSWFEATGIVTAVVFGAIVSFIKLFGKKKDSEQENKSFIDVHTQIHETLTELRVKTNGARAQVIQFHNGEYFMDGVSMRKFSVTHESVEVGLTTDSERIKGLLCSMFLPLLNLVLENNAKIISIYDIPYSFCRQFFEENNVTGFSVLPLKVKNQITGFILLQWCSDSHLDKAEPTLVKYEMEQAKSSIEVQLASQKKGSI
jgi:hypothetical protein